MPREPKLHGLIGLALRSRRVVLGRAACRQAAGRGALHVLIVACDAGAGAERETGVLAAVPRVRCELDKRELGRRAGRMELALLGITDRDLAAGVLQAARSAGDA